MSDRRRKAAARPAARASKGKGTAKAPRRGGRVEVFIGGIRVDVSPELEAAVRRALKGSAVPLPREMTTTQAAEFLDVSRPFVIKLVKRGELPCRMVGKHRRIPGDALLAYWEKMFQRAKGAADEMARTSQELGLYELEGPPPKAR
jgi:excisionase family DNA binding protein